MLDDRQIAFIRDLYINEKLNISQISKRLNINRRTVTKYINAQSFKENAQTTQFTQKLQKVREESNEKLLEMITSNKYAELTETAMGLLTPKVLQEEIDKRGIKAIIGLISNSMDKAMKRKQLAIDEEVKLRSDTSHDQLIKEDDNFNNAILEAIKLLDNTDDLLDKESLVQEH